MTTLLPPVAHCDHCPQQKFIKPSHLPCECSMSMLRFSLPSLPRRSLVLRHHPWPLCCATSPLRWKSHRYSSQTNILECRLGHMYCPWWWWRLLGCSVCIFSFYYFIFIMSFFWHFSSLGFFSSKLFLYLRAMFYIVKWQCFNLCITRKGLHYHPSL